MAVWHGMGAALLTVIIVAGKPAREARRLTQFADRAARRYCSRKARDMLSRIGLLI